MCNIFCAVTVPQLLVTAYLIVSIPIVIPYTAPSVDTKELPLVEVHKPSVTVSESKMLLPLQTVSDPVMVPALGNGLMVTK